MDFKEIVTKRYATKKFTGEQLPQEKVDELFELIRLSASSFGLQTYKIKVISDQETKEKLLPLSFNQEQITTASHVLVFCAYTDWEKRVEQYEAMMKEAGAPTESIEMYTGMMRQFLSSVPKEAIPTWAAKQAYIALGNALNGAKSLGFDSCPMEGFDPEGYAKALSLPDNLIPAVVCPIGIAADEPKPKMRYAKEELFI